MVPGWETRRDSSSGNNAVEEREDFLTHCGPTWPFASIALEFNSQPYKPASSLVFALSSSVLLKIAFKELLEKNPYLILIFFNTANFLFYNLGGS